MPPSASPEFQPQPANEVTIDKEWLAGEQILCYRVNNSAREMVDALALDLQAELHTWDKQRYLRLMLDIGPSASISAYALHRSREIARLRHDLAGKLALVTSNVLTAQICALALRGLANEHRRRLVFTSEAEAVAWLLQDDRMTLSI